MHVHLKVESTYFKSDFQLWSIQQQNLAARHAPELIPEQQCQIISNDPTEIAFDPPAGGYAYATWGLPDK